MDIIAVARDLRTGVLTAESLVGDCLARIALVEPWLHAFAWLDPDRALRLAREADRRARSGDRLGPLHGVPLGMKDIIDTAGLPTECGSALLAGRVPERSATIVTRLEAAGAIIVGKTVTAELAYFHPGPTVNPYDRTRTPGGSSMGSAAAVAADLVPGATGTQTNGSVIRPAAFCGVVGFKTTYGRVPLDGVLAFAPTLDTVGAFATSVRGAAMLASAMADIDLWTGVQAMPTRPRLAVVRTNDWDRAAQHARERFEADCAVLAGAGASIDVAPTSPGLDDTVAATQTVQMVEGARRIGPIVDRDPSQASPRLRALLEHGRRTSDIDYRAALALRERLRPDFAMWMSRFDAVLTLPAVGEAPGSETTGDPRFCSRWTFLGAPAIVLPTGLGPSGLPLGLQLVGRPGDDARLLQTAEWAEQRLSAAFRSRTDLSHSEEVT